MDSGLLDIVFFIAKILGLGLAIGLFIKLFRNKKDTILRTEILNLQAKLSQFKLALRGKVRKKSTVLRSSFRVAIIKDDMIDSALRQLQEIPFDSSSDFQNYFDLSRRVVELSHIGVEPTPEAQANGANAVENNYMSSDFRTELEIVRLIKEMYLLSTKINDKIDDYNRINSKTQISRVDDLKFPSLHEINRVFKDEDYSSQKESA